MLMKPTEYLNAARQDFFNLPADVCDSILARVDRLGVGIQYLAIPDSIPKKYHARMQAVWTVMIYKILFANATRKYTLQQQHQILQKTL